MVSFGVCQELVRQRGRACPGNGDQGRAPRRGAVHPDEVEGAVHDREGRSRPWLSSKPVIQRRNRAGETSTRRSPDGGCWFRG